MIFQKIKELFGFNKANNTTKSKISKEGIIKYFNKRKGFGFIKSEQTEKDVFVHIHDLNDRVRTGDTVQFLVETTDKGLRARRVALVN